MRFDVITLRLHSNLIILRVPYDLPLEHGWWADYLVVAKVARSRFLTLDPELWRSGDNGCGTFEHQKYIVSPQISLRGLSDTGIACKN